MTEQAMRFLTPEEILGVRDTQRLQPGEIHIWPLCMSGLEDSRERLANLLDEQELARAKRYYFERDRKGFVFSRGQMRYLLALYCEVDPAELRFGAGPFGKPHCAPEQSSGISFNLTHSGGRAVLAVSDGRAVGVDLESHDRRTDVLALADRYFFESELNAIRSAPPERQRQLFFRFWTAKEAVLKAQGTGLGVPLDSFRVDVLPAPALSAVQTFSAEHIDERWFLRELSCESGWSAAVVAKGQDWRVRVRDDCL